MAALRSLVLLGIFSCLLEIVYAQGFQFRPRREVPVSSYLLGDDRGGVDYSPFYETTPVAIINQTQETNFKGTFKYSFEASNGISVEASGYVKDLSPDEHGQVMRGSYSYTAPDGTPIMVTWYADETGFHAEGAHIPGMSIGAKPFS